MIDSIISILAYILMLIASLIIYVILVARVLPNLLLKVKFNMRAVHDRGLKKYVFEGGRAITYEPSNDTKKYIEQYILSVNGDEKYIKCKLNRGVNTVKYNVALFDSNDRLIDTLCVCDVASSSGVSRGVMIHADTAYACVNVSEINFHITKMKNPFRLDFIKAGIFALCVTLCTMAVGSVLNHSISAVMDALFGVEMDGFVEMSRCFLIGLALSAAGIFLYWPSADKLRK